jgi:hypothetical protein
VEVAREPAPVLVQTGRAGRWDGVVVRGAPVTIAPAAAEARQRRFHAATPPAEVARRGRPAPGPAVLQGLHEPERLRNAVVLAEVLGPPRALRGWDDPHRG